MAASSSEPRPVAAKHFRVLAAIVLTTLSLAILCFQLSLARSRTHDPDEFQHAHSAFLISQGQLPYRDYFEHHPPLLHFLMAPVMARLHPERDGDAAQNTLFILRVLGWSIAFAGALAHHLLARRLLGSLGGAVASLLLWSTLIVFEKTIEIRPDIPAFALLQVALLLLSREGHSRRIGLSFSLLGFGLLFTQKLAFPILGVIAAVWFERRSDSASKLRESLAMFVGLLWPTVFCAAYFLAHGALPLFIEDVFLINLRWKARLAAWPFFVSRFLEPNPLFAVFGSLGILQGVFRPPSPGPAEGRADRMVLFSAVSGVLGLLMLPVAWEQYYLLFLPQLAILGSGALGRASSAILRKPPTSAWVTLVLLLVVPVSLLPVKNAILTQRFRTSEAKEKAIALILDNSSASDTVLDGYSGIGVFRPHAFRYFFLHTEMRQMLSLGAVRELEDGLEQGAIAPRFASGDSHLKAVSPRVRDFLQRNFAPVGDGPLLLRVFPGGADGWDDTDVRFPGQIPPRSGPYVFALEGWSPRESIGGRTFRRSRGRTSALLFPVKDPDRVEGLVLSARAAADVPGLTATIRLNGKEMGELALGRAFSAYGLPIGSEMLVAGLNLLEFSYPVRPAQINPSLSTADNQALALESIALRVRGAGPNAPRRDGVHGNRDE